MLNTLGSGTPILYVGSRVLGQLRDSALQEDFHFQSTIFYFDVSCAELAGFIDSKDKAVVSECGTVGKVNGRAEHYVCWRGAIVTTGRMVYGQL